jgi:hypothetical protein
MRFAIRLVALAFLSACGDSIVGPNTDVGLAVWAEVSPSTASISDTAAALRIRVYVSNTSFKEIRVRSGGPPYGFTNDPARSQGLWGSTRIANDSDPLHAGPSVDWWGDSVYVFPPRYREYNEGYGRSKSGERLAGRWYQDDIGSAAGLTRARDGARTSCSLPDKQGFVSFWS